MTDRNGDISLRRPAIMQSWQQELVQLHPEMFVRTYRGVPFAPGHPSSCSDGWHDVIAKLVKRVSAAATGYPILFTEIGEARGRLRIHWRAEAALPKYVEHRIEEAVALAEARAACTCMACGANARLFSSGGRFHTACPEHAHGVPVPVRPGMENLHIARTFFCDHSRIECGRYDRIHDRFVRHQAR
jgi:hypothetical protein